MVERDKHVFLVGDLKLPTDYPFFRDDRAELIVCAYQAGDDGRFHWHREVTEYEIVLEGEIGYLQAATGETTWLRAGHVSCVPAGVCVQRRVREPARARAVKCPSRAQKVHCASCDRECRYRQERYTA